MSNVLWHHGILGQKWGVRRFQTKNGSLTPEGKQRYSKTGSRLKAQLKTTIENMKTKHAARKAEKNARRKRVADMTDEELNQRINRLNKEKQYNALMEEINPTRMRFVRKALGKFANDTVSSVNQKAAGKIADMLFGEKSTTTDTSMTDLSKLTDKQVEALRNRIINERIIKDGGKK